MIDEEVDVYFEKSDGSYYLESLAKTAVYLSKLYKTDCSMLQSLGKLIEDEIELAIMGTAKAKSEALAAERKNNVRTIK